jgi:predicted translin family RNA/ssDNA-binding protein
MKERYMTPSEQAKELLIEVFRDLAKQSNSSLTNEHVQKIEEAVDCIVTETSVS